MERTYTIAKLTAISLAIVVAILCLGYSNVYGLTTPQMQLTKPGEQSQQPNSLAGTTAGTQFEFNVGVDSDFSGDDVNLGNDEKCPPVPEPVTLILLGVGLAGIKLLKRRD